CGYLCQVFVIEPGKEQGFFQYFEMFHGVIPESDMVIE
ncbi:MAG: hypothetical protein H6Q57_1410, partial [Geobacteraceae bacterium]|nr:hypothetical protein [Geobacteraceae bacterium]